MQKLYATWGIGIMLIMLLLTILFMPERMYFSDANFMLYYMTMTESISIQELRLGSFITHLFPVLGIKLGASLETIQLLYNLSFFTFFTSVYLCLYFKFKQYDLCILLIAYFTLFVGDVFFWPNNEVHQGICWSFLALGYYYYCEQKGSFSIAAYILIPICMFVGIASHLLVSIPIIFLWIFKATVQTKGHLFKISKRDWIGALMIIAMIGVRYLMSNMAGYDNEKLGPVKHIKFSTALGSFVSPHAIAFYKLLLTWHAPALLAIIIGLGILWKHCRPWNFILYMGAIVGFWMLLNLIYPNHMDRTLWFYMESEYQVIAIVILAPLVYFVLNKKQTITAIHASVIFIVMACFTKIGFGYQYFNQRLKNVQALINYCEEKNITKGIVLFSPELYKKYYIMDWGLPLETLTYSILHASNPITVKIVNEATLKSFNDKMYDKQIFFNCFELTPIPTLNHTYFSLDTTQQYQVLPAEDIIPRLQPLPTFD